jgi:hypothetical protein
LRRAADARFDIFVTADQNLTYQQNLSGSPLRVIVLAAQTNKINDLVPLVPALLLTIDAAQPGEIYRVEPP